MGRSISPWLILVVSMLAQSSYAELKIRAAYSYDGIGEILQEFARIKSVSIQTEYLSDEQMKASLVTMNETTPPEVVILASDQVGLYSYAHFSILDASWFKTTLSDRILGCGFSDGKLYGVPIIQGNHLLLYYNKKLIKAPAKSWQELFHQKVFLDAKAVPTIAWNYDEPYYLLPFLSAFGGWPLHNANIELDTSEMIEALKFYHSMHLNKIYYPQCDANCVEQLFKAGQVGYTISSTGTVRDFAAALGEDLGVSPLPLVGEKKMLSPFSTYVIAFPNDSINGPNRKLLIELIDYLQSPVVQRQLWDTIKAVPVEPSAFDYAKGKAEGHMKQIVELMTETRPVPADQAMTYVWDAMRKGMIRYKEGAFDAESAAEYMQKLTERHVRQRRMEQSAPE